MEKGKKVWKYRLKRKLFLSCQRERHLGFCQNFFLSQPNEMEDEENWPIQSQKAGVLPGPTSAKF